MGHDVTGGITTDEICGMTMTMLSRRLITGLLAVACTAALSTACNDDTTSDGDTGGETDAVADTGGEVGEVGTDTDVPDSGEPDTGVDTGTPDTGPPGEEVTAGSFEVLPTMPASCSEPGERHRVPFYFTRRERTNDGRLPPIRRGDILNGQIVRAGGVMGPGVVTTRRTRVAEASRTSCESADQCSAALKCGESGVRGADRYCARSASVEFIPGTTRQDYDPNHLSDSGQVVAVALQNTGSYEGLVPSLVGTKYDEEGNADLGEKAGRATDPELKNRKAVEEFSTFLATAADSANTKVSLWFFGGQNPSTAQPKLGAQSQQDHFTDDLELPGQLVQELPPPPPKPSNVYQTIQRIIDRDLGIDKYADHEKFLVLITDGPNEVWDDEATKQSVLESLKEHNIHLSILHLDAEVDPNLLRDVPSYWAGNGQCRDDESCDGALGCNSDADCADFETCRKATIYADEEGGQVTETPVKYCLPDYSDGHLGPVGPYTDLACQTGGHYVYASEPQELIYWARKLPYAFDGQWSMEAEISALDPKVGLENGYYRLSGVFMGLLAPNTSSTMSAVSSTGQITHSSDNRGLLRLESGD